LQDSCCPYFQKLIEIGNKDGSLQIDHPKQVAEMFSYLITIWVSPHYSQHANEGEAEFRNMIDTFAAVLASVGLPIIGKAIKDLIVTAFRIEL